MAEQHVYEIAGHGAGDPGACAHGREEAADVRRLAKRVKELGGDRVVVHDLTRNAYKDSALLSIGAAAGRTVVELHRDSGPQSARGATVIIKAGFAPDSCDRYLAERLSALFPGRANSIVGRSDLKNCNQAAARGLNYRLVELGFITNAGDNATYDAHIDEMARIILGSVGAAPAKSEPSRWVKDGTGWWWRESDGSYPRACWKLINGSWFAFDSRGYMRSGWFKDGSKWYYLGEADDGRMRSGWCRVRGEWYLMAGPDDGQMLVGWRKDGGKWYYLRPKKDGAHPEGSMATGWLKYGGEWYYLMPSGEMATGWLKDSDGKWYHLRPEAEGGHPEGSMSKDCHVDGWHVGPDGAWDGQGRRPEAECDACSVRLASYADERDPDA